MKIFKIGYKYFDKVEPMKLKKWNKIINFKVVTMNLNDFEKQHKVDYISQKRRTSNFW